ncbi:hypothetical protein CPB83DRAFT_843433 [Crepidotus variabilis]|uniref:BTB domain-containing protein n=1 Tax=Crepidotus variabilis TaxID=179855 RepID=A0A9P6EUS7_9AGAR|nr:hypothetical protein CPB83DRAFT_843433 [Crepidotus variabilis]
MDSGLATSDGASIRERHSLYFFKMVVFEVEGTLFHVPKDGFTILDPAFFDRFRGPTDEESSEEAPIVIKDTTAESFYGLLLVIYPFHQVKQTFTEWQGALDLATRWRLHAIRTKAITALSVRLANSPVGIARLAKYSLISSLLRDAYAQLVQQKTLSVEYFQGEPNTPDWETIARLISVQKKLGFTESKPLYNGYADAMPQIPLEKIVEELEITFGHEFQAIDNQSRQKFGCITVVRLPPHSPQVDQPVPRGSSRGRGMGRGIPSGVFTARRGIRGGLGD